MRRHLEYPKKAPKFLRITQAAVIIIAMSAGTASAGELTTNDRLSGAAIGGAAGAVTGGAVGWSIDKYKSRPAPLLKGTRTKTAPLPRSQAQIRREYRNNPRAFKKKYHGHRNGWVIDREHTKRVDAAKAEQNRQIRRKVKADAKRAQARVRTENKIRRLERTNPRAASRAKAVRNAKAFDRKQAAIARSRAKHQRNLRFLGKKAGKKNIKTSTAMLSGNRKIAKRGAKWGRVAKGALAGGAAGMVAGAALGERVPDVFDAAAYSVKLVRDPRNAPKMLANTARGGVRMAGRMALTVTDPGKMARNLHGAARGVGRSIANTGAYKRLARTRTGRTIGKGTRWAGRTASKGYKKLARSRTGRAVGTVTRTIDRQVFKRTNKGLRKAGRTISRASKSVGRVAKKTSRKAKRTVKRVGKSIGRAAKKLKFW